MPTVGSLAYAIVANTQQFTSGIVASKQELRTLKEAFLQSQTPVERYSAAIAHLESLAQKFPSKAQVVNATIAQMRKEMFDASEAGQRLAQRNEMIGNVMGRMGLVMDPVSASFQAFNLAVGAAQTALHAFEQVASAVVEEMGRLDELAKKSRKLGIDASDLVGLRRAAEDIAGVTGETFDSAFSVFTRRVAEAAIEGGGEAAKALERLGLSASELSAMLPNDQLLAVADAMSKVRNSGERLALANALLGKSGADLAPMLAAGGAEIRKLAEDQIALSQIKFLDLEAIQEGNDQIARAQTALTGIVSVLASELAPLITDVTADLTDGFDKASGKGEQLRSVMQTVALATAIVVDNLELLRKGISSPDFKNFINFASGGLIPLANKLIGESAGTVIAANAIGDPNSRTNMLVQAQLKQQLGVGAGGETSQTAVKAAEDAEESQKQADKAWKERNDRANEHQERMAKEEEAADKAELDAWAKRAKQAADRQAEIADMEKEHADKVKALQESLATPAEKLKKDLDDLLQLQMEGLDKATFDRALTDLRSKARDLSGLSDVRPQTIGSVRAGSIEGLRAQFDSRNVSEKQLEEQKRAVQEAATANGLLSEIKGLMAANQIKEAL